MIFATLLDAGGEAAGAIGFFLLVIVMIMFGGGFYFLPTIIAWNKRDLGSVAAINFFLGWTLIGWVAALAWALKSESPPAQFVVQSSAPPVSPSPTPPVLCGDCGKYSLPNSRFCSHCGSPRWKFVARP